MQSERLAQVSVGGIPAGILSKRGRQTSFWFTESYLGTPHRHVLGQHFEDRLRTRHRATDQAPNWFANLTPEATTVRKWMANELGLVEDDDFSLLVATGSDLPGAVDIAEYRGDVPGNPAWQLEHSKLEGEESGGLRFSVAGVQLKLSVLMDNNTIRLAGRGELGGWYAKIAGVLDSVPANEHFNLSLARAIGLDVPELELRVVPEGWLPDRWQSLSGKDAFLIKRFDRDGDRRIHIEDFNQAKGQVPRDKYEGMTLESLSRFVLVTCGEEDFWECYRRIIFNILVGNEDAHLKNWSLIYPDGRNPRLSPLYDVVSTVVYPEFDREHGLRLGESKRAETFEAGHLIRLVRKAGMREDEGRRVLAEVIEALRSAEPEARASSKLTKDHWGRVDRYRASVPLARDLVR